MAAVTTAQAQEAAGQDAALEECIELVFDERGFGGKFVAGFGVKSPPLPTLI
jgi:hypothetical protein